MKSLTSEIITLLKTKSYPVTVKTIVEGYPATTPLYPAIIVQEIDNISNKTLLGEELYSTLTYDIEIYARDMIVATVATSSKTTVKGIASMVDTTLNSYYGFKRTVASLVPYSVDNTVSRYLLRYTVILDNKNNITYR